MSLLNPSKLQHFALRKITQPFDFETFSVFMKMYPKIFYELYFSNYHPLQPECVQRLQNFVDQTIATGETENPPPLICFPGLSQDDQNALKILRKKYKYRDTIPKSKFCSIF